MQTTATLDAPPRPQCKVIRGNGQRCKNRALDADWCRLHHPEPAAIVEPYATTVAGIWGDEPAPPVDPLALLELELEALRTARDEAERTAAAALARANRLAVELIATARRRNAMLQGASPF